MAPNVRYTQIIVVAVSKYFLILSQRSLRYAFVSKRSKSSLVMRLSIVERQVVLVIPFENIKTKIK